MSSLPIEIIVFVGKEIYTRSFSPDEEIAKQTAHWHLSKGATLVEIKNKLTGERNSFTRQGENILSEETGEEIFERPGIRILTLQCSSLEKALRAERLAHAKTKQEKEDEMEASPEYEIVIFLFEFWKRICQHPRAVLDLARYRNILPFLAKESVKTCARAIAGAAYDSFAQDNKAGKKVTYNDWEFIFRNRTNFEKEFNRAPANWKELYQFEYEEAI